MHVCSSEPDVRSCSILARDWVRRSNITNTWRRHALVKARHRMTFTSSCVPKRFTIGCRREFQYVTDDDSSTSIKKSIKWSRSTHSKGKCRTQSQILWRVIGFPITSFIHKRPIIQWGHRPPSIDSQIKEELGWHTSDVICYLSLERGFECVK